MKKVSIFAFALIFAGAIACDTPASTEEVTEDAIEVVEEAIEEVEETTEEVMDSTMEASDDAMEEMHDHAEDEDHAEHNDM